MATISPAATEAQITRHEIVLQPSHRSTAMDLSNSTTRDTATQIADLLARNPTCDVLSDTPEVARSLLEAATRERGTTPAGDTCSWSFTKLPPMPTSITPTTVVILGGYGGIAGAIAQQLAAEGHSVVLVDKQNIRELPAKEQARVSDLLTHRSVHAAPNLPAANSILRRENRQTTLLHCAGTLKLRLAHQLARSDLEQALREKTTVLDEALARFGDLISRVCLFGSTESRHAHRRFGLYALTNSALRHQAAHIAKQGIPTAMAEWSLWREVGMAAPSAEFAARAGHAAVSKSWGIAATQRLLFGALPHHSEWALGGPGPTPDIPWQGISGIGGICLSRELTQREALVRHVAAGRPDRPMLNLELGRRFSIVRSGAHHLRREEH